MTIKKRQNSFVALIAFFVVGLACSDLPAQKQAPSPGDPTPKVSVSTEVAFTFQEMVPLLRGNGMIPTRPNRWLITARLVNEGTDSVEVLPVYLFCEGRRVESRVLENARMICPESYRKAIDPNSSLAMTVAPSDATQMVVETIALPLSQLDEPLAGQMGAYISQQTFQASIAVDEKPARWEKVSLAPKSRLGCIWEFWSHWAAPEKVRTGKAFRVIHVGPLISCKTQMGSKAYLAIATLEPVGESGGKTWKQVSFQLKELTPSLSGELLSATPECPSVEVFVKGVVKTWSNGGETLLISAALKGDTKAVEPLLEKARCQGSAISRRSTGSAKAHHSSFIEERERPRWPE